jgi:RHS repeat-associated protein
MIHADHLGRPQKMTQFQGALVWDAVHLPFGGLHTVSGSATNDLRFPGQFVDGETGYFQNWYRDYDPTMGRYAQSDPFGLIGGTNTFAYAASNPLRFVDPSGSSRANWPYGLVPTLPYQSPPMRRGRSGSCTALVSRAPHCWIGHCWKMNRRQVLTLPWSRTSPAIAIPAGVLAQATPMNATRDGVPKGGAASRATPRAQTTTCVGAALPAQVIGCLSACEVARTRYRSGALPTRRRVKIR